MQNGTRLVWIVIPDRKGVEVCRLGADDDIEREFIGEDGSLSGEDVMPGFELPLTRLFS
ncbi:MAG: Uma2 family endonuclease [Anaerolineae bacterium]|nr:Uma2 family endonuclease [Anaerolineae bacterium]